MLNATIALLHQHGYAGAPTDRIADEAGVSRGALRHHFPTRASLMAAVVDYVHEDEMALFGSMLQDPARGRCAADWPTMLWEVLRRPTAQAVLEIVQASRSDAELAALVAPALDRVDRSGLSLVGARIDPGVRERLKVESEDEEVAILRFFVWAVRGLSLAQVTMPAAEIEQSVAIFARLMAVFDGPSCEPRASDSGRPAAVTAPD